MFGFVATVWCVYVIESGIVGVLVISTVIVIAYAVHTPPSPSTSSV
jgi:hypothetical protein